MINETGERASAGKVVAAEGGQIKAGELSAMFDYSGRLILEMVTLCKKKKKKNLADRLIFSLKM